MAALWFHIQPTLFQCIYLRQFIFDAEFIFRINVCDEFSHWRFWWKYQWIFHARLFPFNESIQTRVGRMFAQPGLKWWQATFFLWNRVQHAVNKNVERWTKRLDCSPGLLPPYSVTYTINSLLCNRYDRIQWCDEYYLQHSPIPTQPARSWNTHLENVVRVALNCLRFELQRRENENM